LVVEFSRRTQNNDKSETALKVLNKTKNTTETRDCFYCKKSGHLKKDCRAWKAKMSELQKRGKNQKVHSAVSYEDRSSNNVAFEVNAGTLSSAGWYIDSGATSHMTNDRNFFTEFHETKNATVTVANGQQMIAEGVGDGFLHCQVSDKTHMIPVKDVLYVPTLNSNLLSVKKLTKQGNVVKFKGDNCSILKANKTYAEGKITDDLYELNCEKANLVNCQHHNCIHQWHRRLGHRDPDAVMQISREDLGLGVSLGACSARMNCISCIKGKMARKSFPKCSSRQ